MKTIKQLSYGLLLALSFYQCKSPSVPDPVDITPTRDGNLVMGNPDGTRQIESDPNSYLMDVKQDGNPFKGVRKEH